jgi:hypothetical protein
MEVEKFLTKEEERELLGEGEITYESVNTVTYSKETGSTYCTCLASVASVASIAGKYKEFENNCVVIHYVENNLYSVMDKFKSSGKFFSIYFKL